MEIVPNQNFRDARSIPARFNRSDPRSESFHEPEVIVDLRECARIHSPAVLWCVVYLLLAQRRGSECSLLAPRDTGMSSYLRDVGLYRILDAERVTIESTDSSTLYLIDIVLPLTRFNSTTEAEDLTNQIHYSLSESRQGPVTIYDVLYETFSELANNAAEHSVSDIGAFGLVQFDKENDNRFVCAVADGGIGIQDSLLRNPQHREFVDYEWAAMERATEELVSGTQDSYRGIGLYETVEKMRIPGRQLIIHSGNGIISKGEKLTTRITSTKLFPGTMVYISIPT